MINANTIQKFDEVSILNLIKFDLTFFIAISLSISLG